MWIKKKEIEQLSEFVKGYSSGEELDIRVNKEGSFNILKNDIYALVNMKNEQIKAVETERDSLSDYMADISHQLKTPITSMMIMADLLEEAEPEKQTEFIHNIQVSLNKMEWLVGALLEMAKLDAHAIDFIKNDIHTSELLEAVKPSVAILLDIHNLTIELKQDCIIHCDKRWTTEALTNIVKNAIEYSPDGSVIEIDSGENPMYSWISVRDSGMGMDKTEYAALFKRFENSTNENGFGIGMPLALSILKGQGGDIDVDFGRQGRGNDFYFKIFQVISLMLEDPELFLSDKIVTIIISFVTVQSFCIARMVFRLLRNLLKPKLNCEKLTKDMKDTGEPPALRRLIQR